MQALSLVLLVPSGVYIVRVNLLNVNFDLFFRSNSQPVLIRHFIHGQSHP